MDVSRSCYCVSAGLAARVSWPEALPSLILPPKSSDLTPASPCSLSGQVSVVVRSRCPQKLLTNLWRHTVSRAALANVASSSHRVLQAQAVQRRKYVYH